MKHWKRILSALLIGAMALTLFAGCDKKVKVEDELFKQFSDYYQTLGRTLEQDPTNANAQKLLAYLQENCTSTSLSSYLNTGANRTAIKTNVFPVPSGMRAEYLVGWADVVPKPTSEYYKDPTQFAHEILTRICFDPMPQNIRFSNGSTSDPLDKTASYSFAQGEIYGYQYYLVVIYRGPAVTTT